MVSSLIQLDKAAPDGTESACFWLYSRQFPSLVAPFAGKTRQTLNARYIA